MAAVLEAEDAATPCNVNVYIQKEKASMKIKSNVKAGDYPALSINHNQKVALGLKVKSGVKAGCMPEKVESHGDSNHNQTVARGFKLKTDVKAGGIILDD